MHTDKIMRILSKELGWPQWLEVLRSASRCPGGTIDLSELLIYRTGIGVSVKVKIYRLQPNTTEYDIPKPRPLKPPWSPQHSILPTNNFKMALKSSHPIAIPAQGADTYNCVPWWDSPPFETQSFEPRENSHFAQPEVEQYINYNTLETQTTYSSAPNENTFSTAQFTCDPAFRGKRHISAEMAGLGNATKRQKRSFGSDVNLNQTSILTAGDSTHEKSLLIVPNSTGTSSTETPKALFPCPFYVRDPIKYGTKAHQACMGAGWRIHRLKYAPIKISPI